MSAAKTHNIYTKTPIKEMERNWKTIKQYEEILFEEYEGIAKITINRPRYRNAFTRLMRQETADGAWEVVGGDSREIFEAVGLGDATGRRVVGADDVAVAGGGIIEAGEVLEDASAGIVEEDDAEVAAQR